VKLAAEQLAILKMAAQNDYIILQLPPERWRFLDETRREEFKRQDAERQELQRPYFALVFRGLLTVPKKPLTLLDGQVAWQITEAGREFLSESHHSQVNKEI
jgi:hypothetical protein